jgi:hypothetical protein
VIGEGAAPTLTVAPSLHLLTNFSDTRVIPQVTLAAAFRLGHKHLLYTGTDNAVAFGSPTRVVAGPLLGGQLRVGRTGIALECKWLAPYYDVAPTAPSWVSPASHGYFSVLVGVTYYLGDSP